MDNARKDHLLGALGISAGAEASYRRLAGLGTTTVSAFARQLGVDDATAREQLDELADAGLAAPSPDGWRPLPLELAAATLHRYRIAELDAAREAATSLAAQLRPPLTTSDGAIEWVEGAEAARAQVHRLVAGAERDIVILDRLPSLLRTPPDEPNPLYAAAMRGVAVRAVVDPPQAASPASAADGTAAAPADDPAEPPSPFSADDEPLPRSSAAALVRFALIPLPFVVIDDRVAALPSPDEKPGLVIVHDGRVAARLADLFTQVWSTAVPATGAHLPPRTAALVALLLGGSTDAVIAARLGVTERTVRRWVAELMEQHGVQTRLQLGAALTRTRPPA